MRARIFAVAALALIVQSVVGAQVWAAERIALVIGNAGYAADPLANPVNDARLMSTALRAQGFTVIESLDVGQVAIKEAIKDFGNRIEAAGQDTVGLFYYAGHGVQVDGENYLIPIGAPIEDEADVDIYAVPASNVLKTLGHAANNLNIIVLDACRNNPFVRSFRGRQRGLALMNAPTGTLIAYSTAPGQVASDGDGANSPYTLALATNLGRPGVPIELMFKGVRDAVLSATQGRQTPWEASSLTGPDFYLVPPLQAETEPEPDAGTLDLAFWKAVEGSEEAREYEAYLEHFPDGLFAELARLKILSLREAEEVAVVVPVAPTTGAYDGLWQSDADWNCSGFHQEQISVFALSLDVDGEVGRSQIEFANHRVGHAWVNEPKPIAIAADGGWVISYTSATGLIVVRGNLESGEGRMNYQNSLVNCRGSIAMTRIED
jgi:hypothetical protein